MFEYKLGDRFYFFKNMTGSETIKVGFKGVIENIMHLHWGVLYECGGYGFTKDEIKPIITVKAQLANVD